VGAAEADEVVMWPPAPVMELARITVDSGGDPGAIHRALDPTMLPVPDVEGSQKNKCQLTRTPYGRRFANKELNQYFAFLFELIVARGPSVALNVSLSRYDLFHGHLFLASETGRLGILFHAKEYPAFDKELFPYSLGYCQAGSNVQYDDSMNLRNILWLAPLPSKETKAWLAPGVLVVLDAHPDGIIYQEMIRDHSHRIRGRCLVPRPGNVVPIRGSGSKRVSVPFKVGSCPGLKGVAAPLLADLIGIRRLRTVDWCGFC